LGVGEKLVLHFFLSCLVKIWNKKILLESIVCRCGDLAGLTTVTHCKSLNIFLCMVAPVLPARSNIVVCGSLGRIHHHVAGGPIFLLKQSNVEISLTSKKVWK